ncbi:hypothetical protein HPB50_028842 [Hyalomma asiaticum]|nr:hypothetical protein HPB50_028842 [Hyalomma asiaticum]
MPLSHLTKGLQLQVVSSDGMYYSKRCNGKEASEGKVCVSCRYVRKTLLTRQSRLRHSIKKPIKSASQRLRLQVQKNKRLSCRFARVQDKLKEMQAENASKPDEVLEAQIATLPPKQQECVRQCFSAAKKKSSKGNVFSKNWILECILMKMKSARLYEHIRKHNIISLPSKSTLKRYLRLYKSGYGFSHKVLSQLKKKTRHISSFQRRGGLLVDEIKLSEHLNVTSSGRIEGFVDMGPFSGEGQNVPCDHGMVIMFVPFTGKWTQIIGAFATSGNAKAEILAKVLIEATILAEANGLIVDFITCDGASWNRRMWTILGIGAKSGKITCSLEHPVDSSRQLYFLSDFPHLLKCVRNTLLQHPLNTPNGMVSIQPVRQAFKVDSTNVTLKAMPGLTSVHLQPNSFEKMRVSIAFQLFGDRVINGLLFYQDKLEASWGEIDATVEFFRRINCLIKVMTSRFPARALRPGSMSVQTLKDFLDFMSCWERHANGAGGFLSASTAVGLRVTISSTLALLDHLKKHNFKYLMTARLSQDPLENFFGIVRQSCGSNDHPTPTQFLIVVNCLSFYNLAKAVSSGNAELGEEMSSLLEPSDGSTREVRVDDLDNAVEAGNLDLADRILQRIPSDHKEYVEQKSDDRLIYYMSGYVARKFLKRNDCTECRNVLLLTTAKPAKNSGRTSCVANRVAVATQRTLRRMEPGATVPTPGGKHRKGAAMHSESGEFEN